MKKRVKILHFENNESNAKLIESKIELENMSCEFKRVYRGEDYKTALMTDVFDVVLCDYSLPDIDWINAVRLAKNISSYTSFIFISSNEEKTNGLEKYQLLNFIPKAKLNNLNPAINRAISEIESHNGISCYWG